MLGTIGRRLLSIIVVSIVIVYLAFLGMDLVASTDNPEIEHRLLDSMAVAAEQSVAFFSGLLGGDLGTVPTVSGERAVGDILWTSFKNSMALLLIAVTAGSLIGVVLGVIAGLKVRGRRQYVVLMATIAGVSIPAFFLAVLLQQAGIKYTITFGRQLVSMGGHGWDFRHMAMPVLVLMVWPLAYVTRATYISLGRILEEDYIRTAYSKGLRRSQVIGGHAFRNLAIPVLTASVVSFRYALSVLLIAEFIFAWPGMGLRILQATNDRIPLLVASIALVIGLTLQLLSFAVDIAYRTIDPRLRVEA